MEKLTHTFAALTLASMDGDHDSDQITSQYCYKEEMKSYMKEGT